MCKYTLCNQNSTYYYHRLPQEASMATRDVCVDYKFGAGEKVLCSVRIECSTTLQLFKKSHDFKPTCSQPTQPNSTNIFQYYIKKKHLNTQDNHANRNLRSPPLPHPPKLPHLPHRRLLRNLVSTLQTNRARLQSILKHTLCVWKVCFR